MHDDELRAGTVLVTGATGFIGRHLVERLRREERLRLVLLSRSSRTKRSRSELWIQSPLEDLTTTLWRQAGIEQVDVVFHLGAFTPRSQRDVNDVFGVFQGNVLGTRALLASLDPAPRRFVFASSVDVYAAPASRDALIDEASPASPKSLHGASKLFCEKLIEADAAERAYACSILRYGHVYGPGEEAYEKLIPKTIERLRGGQPPVLYGDGNLQRDLLYVDDAVTATLRAASSDDPAPGPINVVSGESVSIREVIHLLARLTGYHGEILEKAGTSSGHSLRFDNRCLLERLGVKPSISLEEGLRRELAYLDRRARYVGS